MVKEPPAIRVCACVHAFVVIVVVIVCACLCARVFKWAKCIRAFLFTNFCRQRVRLAHAILILHIEVSFRYVRDHALVGLVLELVLGFSFRD